MCKNTKFTVKQYAIFLTNFKINVYYYSKIITKYILTYVHTTNL